ncbi:MAG: sulfurtransferase TusA [Succinivibrio dextrinosolvens]|uniref:tRNA 2-thiouridine synthesizing protein A n=1 Tax=Succinivibrio dextrinosolvens TaxID=83771 RepID=A0A662Z9L6_9GAMM|nr:MULTISPECIES: sulfurtransferase TusA [Succinivibrio]MBQ9221063.1 sulfurtransferase TusA [Succinivibrio sp.]MDY6415813.1 sulfurtransferase TusA [Succinivibrio dextrinosolvens]MDY6419565.1 sulfurtransferase TusA [Succinivibrio dextrinosolvens]MDY6465191.1 sulfurtransferase TusA [Succinivibrio dextrinosolvens]MDY6470918.1 sulfurtransferase TusA [Succinivibrio dextrinosolvens]
MDTITLDCRGMKCPEPLTMLRNAVRKANSGQIVELLSDDPVSERDVPAFCKFMKHELLRMPTKEHPYSFLVKKKE